MEATMIKKIILLVLSFSFSVTSVVYGTVTKADPVSSGTGTGTSVKIENTSALSKVMSQIPSYDDYTGEKSISELYPDFKPFTMVETGYGSMTTESVCSRSTVEDGEIEYVSLIQKNIETTNHSLSISFTEDAVYYHSIGSKLSTNIYYEYEINEDSGNYRFDTQEDFVDAERTVINYDAEIYHSKDATLIKYNKYETLKEFADTNRYQTPLFKPAEEEVLTDEDEIMQKEMQEKVEKIREDNYGVWLKLETYSDEELEEKFGDLMNSDTPPSEENYEQLKNVMIDYMIYETCNLVSKSEAESFAKANASNCAYLGILSDFITSDNENVNFEKNGNEYKLVNSKNVLVGTDPETNQPVYEYVNVGEQAYISAIFGNQYNDDDHFGTNVNFSYVVGSDVAVVDQYAQWWTAGDYNRGLGRRFDMDTVTNFFALDNTVAAIEKNAKVKTIEEAYGKGLRAIYSEYMDKMMSEGDN